MDIFYPFQIDGRGRVRKAEVDDHIRHLIEQLLFTSSGERVNRPTFGTGLSQMVFAPNSEELATATEFLIQGALQQWLGELIQLEGVQVTSDDSTLRVTVQYVNRQDQQRSVTEVSREY